MDITTYRAAFAAKKYKSNFVYLNTVSYFTIQHGKVLYSTIQYCTAPYSAVQYCTAVGRQVLFVLSLELPDLLTYRPFTRGPIADLKSVLYNAIPYTCLQCPIFRPARTSIIGPV